MANNPTNYSPNLPRVSSIVEFVYPFIGESKDRFHSWLAKNNISLADYMEEASTGWTYVHKAMEDLGDCKPFKWKKYKEINWEKWLLDWKSYWLAKEKFNLPNNYKKPYDKLKKARLQLSLYNRALKYKYKLAVVELTPSGYYFHVLEQLPKEELEELIFLYKNNYIDQL